MLGPGRAQSRVAKAGTRPAVALKKVLSFVLGCQGTSLLLLPICLSVYLALSSLKWESNYSEDPHVGSGPQFQDLLVVDVNHFNNSALSGSLETCCLLRKNAFQVAYGPRVGKEKQTFNGR